MGPKILQYAVYNRNGAPGVVPFLISTKAIFGPVKRRGAHMHGAVSIR